MDLGSRDYAEDVAIQPDGKIVVAGYMGYGYSHDSVVTRLTSDGSWDTTFGANGAVITDLGGDDGAYACLIQSDGKIVVVGTDSSDFAIVRYDASHLDYTNGDGTVAIDTELTLTDSDDSNMASATIQITDNYLSTEDKLWIDSHDLRGTVTGSWNSATGALTLSGLASVEDYAYMLQHVTYTNSKATPNTDARTVSWTVTDGHGSNCATRHSTIEIDYRPVLSDIGKGLNYHENDPAAVIDGYITLTDGNDAKMASATIQITENYQSGEDKLGIQSGYSLPSGVSKSWDATTGKLTITGSAPTAAYEEILEHVTYVNSSDDPSTDMRIVTWMVNDGVVDSEPVTDFIVVYAVNDPPVLFDLGGAIVYAVGDDRVVIDNSITLTDLDNANMRLATIQITETTTGRQAWH